MRKQMSEAGSLFYCLWVSYFCVGIVMMVWTCRPPEDVLAVLPRRRGPCCFVVASSSRLSGFVPRLGRRRRSLRSRHIPSVSREPSRKTRTDTPPDLWGLGVVDEKRAKCLAEQEGLTWVDVKPGSAVGFPSSGYDRPQRRCHLEGRQGTSGGNRYPWGRNVVTATGTTASDQRF